MIIKKKKPKNGQYWEIDFQCINEEIISRKKKSNNNHNNESIYAFI